jgi:hypothetical protein
MPNGGSDCCGSCWFNERNKGEAGFGHARDPELSFCSIRKFPIENPFWTYCANHPLRRPDRDVVPIGPVFVDAGSFPYHRILLLASPDTEEVRQHLLELLLAIQERPEREYPAAPYLEDVVVRQLGEWLEARALPGLERVAAFDPKPTKDHRTRKALIAAARDAIAKIKASSATPPTQTGGNGA